MLAWAEPMKLSIDIVSWKKRFWKKWKFAFAYNAVCPIKVRSYWRALRLNCREIKSLTVFTILAHGRLPREMVQQNWFLPVKQPVDWRLSGLEIELQVQGFVSFRKNRVPCKLAMYADVVLQSSMGRSTWLRSSILSSARSRTPVIPGGLSQRSSTPAADWKYGSKKLGKGHSHSGWSFREFVRRGSTQGHLFALIAKYGLFLAKLSHMRV